MASFWRKKQDWKKTFNQRPIVDKLTKEIYGWWKKLRIIQARSEASSDAERSSLCLVTNSSKEHEKNDDSPKVGRL